MRIELAVLVVLLGCEAADPEASGERAWVMVEEAAAREGWRVAHADWVDAPRLPTEIDPAEAAILRAPGGDETVLSLSPGLLAHVGAGGEVERLEPGIDVPIDRLIARGDPEAIGELADVLDAGLSERDGDFVLEADGLFEVTSFVELPDGVDDVGLDRRASPAPGAIAGFAMVGADGERAAMLVGAYVMGADVVVIDAEGGFSWSKGCRIPTRAGRVVIEDQRIVLVGDDGHATALAIDAERRLVGDDVTLTAMGVE